MAEDDFDVTVTLTVDSDYFSCSNCGLVLSDPQLLEEAGLSMEFYAEGDSSEAMYYEGDYGND